MSNKLTIAATAFVLILVAGGDIYRWQVDASKSPTLVEMSHALPDAKRFAERNNKGCLSGFGEGNAEEAGCVGDSDHFEPEAQGYGGPIRLVVGVSPKGDVEGVIPFSQSETPAYWRAVVLAGYLDHFRGRNAAEDFSGIQAVTGATVTCNAIKSEVAGTARGVARGHYGLDMPNLDDLERYSWRFWPMIGLLTAILLGISAVVLDKPRLRLASWLASVAVLGFWLNVAVSLPLIIDILQLKWPGGVSPEPLILLAVALIASLAGRNIYCQQVCPFGALQELVYQGTPGRLRPSASNLVQLRRLRNAVLFLAVIAAAAIGYAPAASFEPFGSPFTLATPLPLAGFAGLILLGSALKRRLWCRIFCPTGACLDLALKVRNREKSVDASDDKEAIDVTPTA